MIDPIVRDTLLFAAQPTGPVDVSLARSGPGALAVNGTLDVVNATPASAFRVFTDAVMRLDMQAVGTLALTPAAGAQALVANGYVDIHAATGNSLLRGWVGADQRIDIGPTGTLVLTPSAGSSALVFAGGTGALDASAGNPRLASLGAQNLELYGNGGFVHPTVDGAISLGAPSKKWATVYAATGAINTSTYEAKEDFAPLDPALCATAVLETDWVSFAFKAPPPPWEAEGAPKEAAARGEEGAGGAGGADAKALVGAHARMLLETAPARRQKGYVLQSPEHQTHELFGLEDRSSASPGSDLAVVAAALQHALQRIAALEAAGGSEAPAA